MAVLDPVDRAGVGIGGEGAFEVAARAEDVARSVDGGAVGRQVEDRSCGARVSHDAVRRPWQERSVAESSAASPYAEVEPFIDVNEPPAMTLLPLGVRTSAWISLLAVGAQPSSAPFDALNAASLERATLFALLNAPPT